MSAGLIKHLKNKTEQDPNTKILMSQWEFDEKLVGKSLENVGSYYPHFSSHNESHSQQILVNIERLLGDNISKLTATDTWLILEAAYWHDIGMLFSADDVQEVVNNEKFKDYVEELANNNAQDLHEFAKVWHNEGWEVALVSYDNPYKGVEKYRQMVAEWYRRDHPQNSQQVVLKPFEKLNISSPRTELLPQRIYRYLAQICLSHGKSFNYVMSELPFRQTGMGTENCHPRFVACMLRLGDLFDIDDNRFCPVMARQVGNMPSLSETHKHKHQAIREFQLDNETVSVTAICDTEMSYIECRRWFDWIKEEIQDQMSQWKNIVPSRDFGLLPTINKLDVEMADSKVLLNNKPMKFSLDERSAIELLQGNNLYEDDMSIYRELIQNAIDATMIRGWLEHGHDDALEPLPKNANPYDTETREILSRYPITLDCKKIAENEESTLWEFIIEDNGIGISKKDLAYMQKIAGSKNNKEKQRIVRDMPEWMRPSGEFGIGLHSAFLLMKDLPTDQQKIVIYTKSRLTHESLRIELNSPLSGKAGYCFIEEISDLSRYGTTLKVLENFSVNNSERYIGKYYADDYPKLIHSLLGIEGVGVNKALKRLSDVTNIITNPTLHFKVNADLEPLLAKRNLLFNNSLKEREFYWDEKLNVALTLIYEDEEETTNNYYFNEYMEPENIAIMYRGQLVHSPDIDFNLGVFDKIDVRILIDIYSSHSSNILNLSREEIHNTDYINNLLENVFDNLLNRLCNNNELIIRLLYNDTAKASLFMMLTGLQKNSNDEWKKYPLNESYSFLDLLNCDTFTVGSPIVREPEHSIYRKTNTVYIDSKVLSYNLDNEHFEEVLVKNNFKKYVINSNLDLERPWNLPEVYSKIPLEDKYWTEEPIIDDKSEQDSKHSISSSFLCSINRFLSFENFSIEEYLSSDNYSLDFVNEIDKTDLSFLKKKTFEELVNLHSTYNLEKLFIFPFIYFENGVIEIPNEVLYEIYDSKSTTVNQNISKIYSIIKKEIVDIAKTENPDWYEKYQYSLNLSSIDLGSFGTLHKPES